MKDLLKIPPGPKAPGEIWELSKPPHSLIMIISIKSLQKRDWMGRGVRQRVVYWVYNIQKQNKFAIKDRALLARYRKVEKTS
tara:strand:- start:101 stop:346 length:246 start_codon:yes stop_codon:yes gene_type:complete